MAARELNRSTRNIVSIGLMIVLGVVTVASIAAGATRPRTIALPDGFQPEGIATRGKTFYVGSIPTGAIVIGDLRTGETSPLVAAQEGRSAIGLSLRDGILFVAGGSTGQAYAYDARSGANLALWQLTTTSAFINDVVAAADAAYFTDSVNQVIYRVPILGEGSFGTPQTIPITGDLVYETGFNANGIDATPDGGTLIVVQSNTGELFTVNPLTGVSQEIDLGTEAVTNGDGILLDGNRLWVVENFDNVVTLISLSNDLSSGTVLGRFGDTTFDVPTTVAEAGNRLVFVNARFRPPTAPLAQPADYWVTQLRKPKP